MSENDSPEVNETPEVNEQAEITEPAEVAETPEATEPAEASNEPTEVKEVTEDNEAGEVSEPTEVKESGDAKESAEVTESSEATEPQGEGDNEESTKESSESSTEEEDEEPDEEPSETESVDKTEQKEEEGSEEGTEETPKEAHPLDYLTDQELIKLVDNLKTETKHLRLENTVFEHFLQKNDASLIVGMAQILETAQKLQLQSQAQTHASVSFSPGTKAESVPPVPVPGLPPEAAPKTTTTTTTVTGSEKGPRINISQKTDLVMRETEEIQVALEKFIKRSHRTKCNLKAEIEEFNVRESEIKESAETFEQTIVIEGVEKLTSRIPAEKFLRYMEEWLKSAEFMLEKLRLRTSTLNSQYTKLAQQLVLKEEIGEMLHAVDFEQLHIKNTHFLKKIEEKNTHLLELKRMNGRANLMLTTQKQYLQDQINELNKLKAKIAATEKKMDKLDNESERAEKEAEVAQAEYEEVKELTSNYRVPDVIHYIKKKTHLYEIKKSTKIWTRRNHIQKIALEASTRQMKTLTGSKKARASWYNIQEYSDENSSKTSISMKTNASKQ